MQKKKKVFKFHAKKKESIQVLCTLTFQKNGLK